MINQQDTRPKALIRTTNSIKPLHSLCVIDFPTVTSIILENSNLQKQEA
jgi:hypothetical protein